MLSISTLDEAVAYLSRETGQCWSTSRLLELAVVHNISLQAAVPLGVTTVTVRPQGDSGYLEDFPSHPLALLSPDQVKQLWLRDAAETNTAADIDDSLGQYSQLSSPIRVSRKDVRVSACALEAILAAAGTGKTSAPPLKVVPTAQAQDAAVLREIELRGFCPTALPPYKAGHRGVKADMKEKLLKEQVKLFKSESAFERTWSRLKACRDIAYSGDEQYR